MGSIRRQMGYTEPYFAEQKPVKDKDYLAFVRKLPCAVIGCEGVDAAHLSTASRKYGHNGFARASKASDRWALPLSREQHDMQHDRNEMAYWEMTGIDPHALALSLYTAWLEYGDDAERICRQIINEHRP